jgi:bisanhydrobacterioruberin hydratase
MERKTFINKYAKFIFVYIIFFVGIVGHVNSHTFDIMIMLTTYTLFMMGTFVLYHAVKKNGLPILFWAAGTYIVTFTLEAVGVHTGAIFGGYDYGEVLAPSLFGVPLIIGYNWVFVILGAACITQYFITRPVLFALITGIIAVIFDVFLEPVAIQLGYWSWETGYIPLQNYAAWFAISFAAAFILRRFRIAFYTPVAIHYFVAQAVFFISLNVLL